MCVRACVCIHACVRACVCACVRACVCVCMYVQQAIITRALGSLFFLSFFLLFFGEVARGAVLETHPKKSCNILLSDSCKIQFLIRDHSSDLYVGMEVVEMFDCTIGMGERKSSKSKALTLLSTLHVKKTCPKSRVLMRRFAASITHMHCVCVRTTFEDHGCTTLWLLFVLCCGRTVRSTCVGVRNVICEFIWTAATVLFAQVRTGF